jgi:hypothetical protein
MRRLFQRIGKLAVFSLLEAAYATFKIQRLSEKYFKRKFLLKNHMMKANRDNPDRRIFETEAGEKFELGRLRAAYEVLHAFTQFAYALAQ